VAVVLLSFDGDLPRHRRYAGASVRDHVPAGGPAGGVGGRPVWRHGHGRCGRCAWQHLLRDANTPSKKATRCSRRVFRLLLLRAVAIGKRRDTLKDSTLHSIAPIWTGGWTAAVGPRAEDQGGTVPVSGHAPDRDEPVPLRHRRDVPSTNNACERALRPSVIFRKVNNCFRAEWGAKVYAAAASVIAQAVARLTAIEPCGRPWPASR